MHFMVNRFKWGMFSLMRGVSNGTASSERRHLAMKDPPTSQEDKSYQVVNLPWRQPCGKDLKVGSGS